MTNSRPITMTRMTIIAALTSLYHTTCDGVAKYSGDKKRKVESGQGAHDQNIGN